MCIANCEISYAHLGTGVFCVLLPEPVLGTWSVCPHTLGNVWVSGAQRRSGLTSSLNSFQEALCVCAGVTGVNDFQDLTWIWLCGGGLLLMPYCISLPFGAVFFQPSSVTLHCGGMSLVVVKPQHPGGGCSVWDALQTGGLKYLFRTLKEARWV